jgi:hypothetical protein
MMILIRFMVSKLIANTERISLCHLLSHLIGFRHTKRFKTILICLTEA